MKRIIALLCAIAMLTLGVAAAGEEMAAGLPEVTMKVKEALNIGDEYDEFVSDYYDGKWELRWSNSGEWLNVNCDGDGKILYYYYYKEEPSMSAEYAPRYSKCTDEELKAIAEDFLADVITGENEGWILDDVDQELLRYKYQRFSVNGRLTLHGLPTDIEINVVIDPVSLAVTDYSRGDSYMEFTSLPDGVSEGETQESAAAKLNDTVEMELVYYVTEPGEMARLVYMPVDTSNYAVRVSDGELINVNEQYYGRGLYYANTMDMAAEEVEGAAGKQLTEAELAGISVYDGALSIDELDALLRGMPELGVTDEYAVNNANYYKSGDDLIADINYRRELTDDDKKLRGYEDYDAPLYDTRNITLRATDGKLISVYSYYEGIRSEGVDVDESALIDKAAEFMAKYFGEYSVVGHTETVNASDYSWASSLTCNFVRVHNGHPFRDNSISVEVNAGTGVIDSLYIDWNNTQEFDEPDETAMIDAQTAKDIFISALPVRQGFVTLPEGNDGWDYAYMLEQCWQFDNAENVYAVDAVTGDMHKDNVEAKIYEYSDLNGGPADEIAEKLGSYGVGFEGGVFDELADFTLRDALTIILQASSRSTDAIEARSIESIIEDAYALGAPDLSGIEEDCALTKAEFARILVAMSGYGDAAELPGIFACGFADDADVAADDYGYIAIAYGLGLIGTDAEGYINAYAPLTRADGVTIFHNLLMLD